MFGFLSRHYWALRICALVPTCITGYLGLLWCYDPQGNYEPLISFFGLLAGLIGIPTIAESVRNWQPKLSMQCVGEIGSAPAELILAGIEPVGKTCFVHVPMTLTSSEPLKNVAIRIVVPRRFIPEMPSVSQEVENQSLRFEVAYYDEHAVLCNVLVPSIRIDEPFTVSLPVKLEKEDWVRVNVAHRQTRKGKWSMASMDEEVPCPVIGIPIAAHVYSDTTRPITRKWQLWFTESNKLEKLMELSTGVITIARIWALGNQAFRLPVFGNIVVLPHLFSPMRREQSAILVQFIRQPSAITEETLYEPEQRFVPMKVGRYMIANPSSRALHHVWVNEIESKKPNYFT